jgi:hypothetical protein
MVNMHSAKLSKLLADLLDVAQCYRIDIDARASDRLSDQYDAINQAASQYRLQSGRRMDELLWAGNPGYGSDRLQGHTEHFAQWSATKPDRLLLTFAEDVSRHAAYSLYRSPLRVRDGIAGDLIAQGPYVVLIRYQVDRMGDMRPTCGFARSILGTSSFMPVANVLEREVFQILLYLQERLDGLGRDSTIERQPWAESEAGPIEMVIHKSNGAKQRLQMTFAPCTGSPAPGCRQYAVTRDSLADGSLVSWLCAQIQLQQG